MSPGLICKTETVAGDENPRAVGDLKVCRADDWTNTAHAWARAWGSKSMTPPDGGGLEPGQVRKGGRTRPSWAPRHPRRGAAVAREIPPLNEQVIFPHAIRALQLPERKIDTPPGDVAGTAAGFRAHRRRH